MPKISISYRRADSAAIAGRIYDRLSAQYGEQAVFLDIDSIAVGADFRHQLQENLRASDQLLVIIGPGWLGKTPGGKTRINESHDPIRLEIETALTLGLVIVPVLVGGAVMPRPDEVPFSLQDLTFRNAAEVDSGRDFFPAHGTSYPLHRQNSRSKTAVDAATGPRTATAPTNQSRAEDRDAKSRAAGQLEDDCVRVLRCAREIRIRRRPQSRPARET